MPFKLRLIITLISVMFLTLLAQLALHGWWITGMLWMGVGLLALDVLWPKFDLAGASYWRGKRDRNVIALTFDDGPDPRFTPQILKVLKELNVKATFFVLGKFAEQYPNLIEQIARDGHEIGTHGYSHTKFTKIAPKTIEYELKRWQEMVHPHIGNAKVAWLRPPHGWKHSWVRKIAGNLGYKLAGWTTGVWDTDSPGIDVIVSKATKNVRAGDILLLHDGDGSGRSEDRSQTVSAVPTIIDKLSKNGFSFVTLSELFPTPKRQIQIGRMFLGALVTVAFATYVAKHFDLAEIRRNLSVPFPMLLLVSVGLDLFCLFLKSQAWREMILPLKRVKRTSTFAFYLAGAMLNNILPFRAGDIGRADLLGRKEDVDRVHGLSTTALEGILNGISLLPILFVALFLFPLAPILQKIFASFSVLVIVGFVAILFIAKKSNHPWLKAIHSLRYKRRVFNSYLFYFAAWIVYFASLTAVLRASGIHTSFWAAPVMALTLAGSMFIPSGPARLGAFEAAIALSLSFFNIPGSQAIAFALVLHTTQTLPTLLWGAIAYLFAEKAL